MRLRPIEIILMIAVAYLLYDKFKPKPVQAKPVNGAIAGLGLVDDFDLQVQQLIANGY